MIENTVTLPADQTKAPVISSPGVFVAVFFLAWFVLILILGSRGAFVTPRGEPPLALLLGLVVPLSLFLLG